MKDITQSIFVWVACCAEVWERWFKELENGEDEFGEVEEALFSALVLSSADVMNRPGLADCYKLMSAVYKTDVADTRSVCREQKVGNTYCESRLLEFGQGTVLPVKSIDFMGLMLDGRPYVELIINDQEYALEPIENLEIKMNY